MKPSKFSFPTLLIGLLCLLAPRSHSFSQATSKQHLENKSAEQSSYQFTSDIKLYEYSMTMDSVLKESAAVAMSGYQFQLLVGLRTGNVPWDKKGNGEYYLIKFLDFNKVGPKARIAAEVNIFGQKKKKVIPSKTSLGLIEKFNHGSDSIQKYYCLKASDLNEDLVQRRYVTGKTMLSVGALIVPVKIRSGFNRKDSTNVDGTPIPKHVPMDFSTDVTLGSSVGAKWRISHYQPNYVNALFGFGVTTVQADSSSTRGVLKEENLRLGAFTLTGGILLEFNKFQVGGFIGGDFVGKAISIKGKSAWDYQGKPWISLGMGYQIISRNDEKKGLE